MLNPKTERVLSEKLKKVEKMRENANESLQFLHVYVSLVGYINVVGSDNVRAGSSVLYVAAERVGNSV